MFRRIMVNGRSAIAAGKGSANNAGKTFVLFDDLRGTDADTGEWFADSDVMPYEG